MLVTIKDQRVKYFRLSCMEYSPPSKLKSTLQTQCWLSVNERIFVLRLHGSFMSQYIALLCILGEADPRLDDTDIQVTEADFRKALDSLTPSFSQQELKRYKDIQQRFAVANTVTKSR